MKRSREPAESVKEMAVESPKMRMRRGDLEDAERGETKAGATVRAMLEAGRAERRKVDDLFVDWSNRTRTADLQKLHKIADASGNATLSRYVRMQAGVPWWYDPGEGIDRPRYPWDPDDLVEL